MRISLHNKHDLLLLLGILLSSLIIITAQNNPPPIQVEPVDVSSSTGWSCDDFPCEDDIDGFLNRIQVPENFHLSYVGQFPGQPLQIAYGLDGKLYATILEKGTRQGSVYRLNEDNTTERVSPRFWSPVGIAFNKEGELYVSSRLNPDNTGVIWRVISKDHAELVVNNLPCCYSIENQPNGLIFGNDGLLYIGIGSTSDRGESSRPEQEQYATPQPYEASVLKINVDTGEIQIVASGIRNPYDLTFTSDSQLYVTDIGLVTGEGDRLLEINDGEFYGFPYWRTRGCPECPASNSEPITDDWLSLTNYTRPRGITTYTGSQFPSNFIDTLFVAFWNGTDYAQRVVWIDPDRVPQGQDNEDYNPQPFVTGLIRPTDVVIAPDGSLVIADFIYGHIWQVSYNTISNTSNTQSNPETTPTTNELPAVIETVVSNTQDNIQSAPATLPTNVIFATATPSN